MTSYDDLKIPKYIENNLWRVLNRRTFREATDKFVYRQTEDGRQIINYERYPIAELIDSEKCISDFMTWLVIRAPFWREFAKSKLGTPIQWLLKVANEEGIPVVFTDSAQTLEFPEPPYSHFFDKNDFERLEKYAALSLCSSGKTAAYVQFASLVDPDEIYSVNQKITGYGDIKHAERLICDYILEFRKPAFGAWATLLQPCKDCLQRIINVDTMRTGADIVWVIPNKPKWLTDEYYELANKLWNLKQFKSKRYSDEYITTLKERLDLC